MPDKLTLYSTGDPLRTSQPERSRSVLLVAGIFLFSFLVLVWIQFSTYSLVDYDGYYHIKMADLIRSQGIPTYFPWLPYTILDESRFTDHHFLFHVLQVPFTLVGDLRLAAKISAVFLAACSFAFFGWLLHQYRVPYPFLWLLLLFASASPFLYRMSMPRAQSLSLLLQLIAFYLIQRRRHFLLLVLSAIFVWAYNAFPTIAVLVGIGFVTELICEKRWDFRLLLFSAAGVLLGLVVNPYFPNNVGFLWNHIGPKVFAGSYQTSVGGEWYPYSSFKLMQLSFVALIGYGISIAVTNRKDWIFDKPRLFWILVSTVYLILLMKSRRFVEYFPPFAILALVFSCRQFLTDKRLFVWIKSDRRLAAAICGSVVLLALFGHSVYAARKDVKDSHNWQSYRGAAQWLQENTPKGSIVFHADWDDFPMLFFFNTHNRYIVGLDADFMRLRNEPLYRKYEEITQGRMENPADYICRVFRSGYVFTDQKHGELIRNLKQSGRAEQVYNDQSARVFRLSGCRAR